MNGVLVQLMILAGYGSKFLMAPSGTEPPELFETNPTFQTVHSIGFLGDGSEISKLDVIKGTKEWLGRLRLLGCSRILLEIMSAELESDATSLGWFTGECPWAIRTVQASTTVSWVPRWMTIPGFVATKPSAEKRIWDITYSPKPGRTEIVEGVSLEQARSELKEALEEAIDFSSEAKLSFWSGIFSKAWQSLSEEGPELASYYRVPQDCYSLPTRQLLLSAEQAWVFGGMGTWNDIGFNNPSKTSTYNRISRKLYSSILRAIVTGVNRPLLASN